MEYRYPKVYSCLRKKITETAKELGNSGFAWFGQTKVEQGRNGKSKQHTMMLGDKWIENVDGVEHEVSMSLTLIIVEKR